jgi:calcineurin-like phosphoesterase family protein
MRFDWFYSDPHFGHKKIIEYCDRPFDDTLDMEEQLILRFNQRVLPLDKVLWLGDCFFENDERAANILSRMAGQHFLVCGNHDRKSRRMVKIGFQFAVKQLVWQQNYVTFRGSHFPWLKDASDDGRKYLGKWHPKYNKEECLVHGHTHSKKKHNGGNAIHVGVDAWDYRPVSFGEVLGQLRRNGLVP